METAWPKLILKSISPAYSGCREIILNEPCKIGRAVGKIKAQKNNGIFDCKVLSRNHAIIWYENEKFFLKDTKSSNGTFANKQRLSEGNEESLPYEIFSNDQIQFGVDVVDNQVVHSCITCQVILYHPDGKLAEPNMISMNNRDNHKISLLMADVKNKEMILAKKQMELDIVLDEIEAYADNSWKAMIDEDSLLSKILMLETELQLYKKPMPDGKLRKQMKELSESKHMEKSVFKNKLGKLYDEKSMIQSQFDNLKYQLSERELQNDHLNKSLIESQAQLETLYETKQYLQEELDALQSHYKELELKYNEVVNELNHNYNDGRHEEAVDQNAALNNVIDLSIGESPQQLTAQQTATNLHQIPAPGKPKLIEELPVSLKKELITTCHIMNRHADNSQSDTDNIGDETTQNDNSSVSTNTEYDLPFTSRIAERTDSLSSLETLHENQNLDFSHLQKANTINSEESPDEKNAMPEDNINSEDLLSNASPPKDDHCSKDEFFTFQTEDSETIVTTLPAKSQERFEKSVTIPRNQSPIKMTQCITSPLSSQLTSPKITFQSGMASFASKISDGIVAKHFQETKQKLQKNIDKRMNLTQSMMELLLNKLDNNSDNLFACQNKINVLQKHFMDQKEDHKLSADKFKAMIDRINELEGKLMREMEVNKHKIQETENLQTLLSESTKHVKSKESKETIINDLKDQCNSQEALLKKVTQENEKLKREIEHLNASFQSQQTTSSGYESSKFSSHTLNTNTSSNTLSDEGQITDIIDNETSLPGATIENTMLKDQTLHDTASEMTMLSNAEKSSVPNFVTTLLSYNKYIIVSAMTVMLVSVIIYVAITPPQY